MTSEEKIKSINIHGGDESDVGHRKEMYKKYFGSDGAWENTLPPFVETEPSPAQEAAVAVAVVTGRAGRQVRALHRLDPARVAEVGAGGAVAGLALHAAVRRDRPRRQDA